MEVLHVSGESGSTDDAVQTVEIARKKNASWIVVDGYHFGSDYQRHIKDAGFRLLSLDDYAHAKHYFSDIVLNQNLHAHETLYNRRESYTDLFLGTPYVLLRKEFLIWRKWRKEISDVARRVLVTLGGGDPDNVTLKVIQALRILTDSTLEAVVVVGGENPHYDVLQDAVEEVPFSVRLERDVPDMAELMAWADIAVSAGGSTCWEQAFIGVPAITIALAKNQTPIAKALDKAGAGVDLGFHETIEKEKIAKALESLVF